MAKQQKALRKEERDRSRQADVTRATDLGQREATPDSTMPLHEILNRGLTLIEATSGSLMLVDSTGEWLEVEARLGIPHEREEEPRYRVGEGSIAGWVAETGKPYLCPDVEKDPHFAPSRSGRLNFKSLLAVPIIWGNTVLGVINADDPKESFFTADNMQRLSDFANQVAFAVAKRLRRRQVLDSLHQVGVSLTRLTPETELTDVLKQIAEQAVRVLGIDLVTLYQYDRSTGDFLVEGTGPTIAGELLDPGPMKTKIYPDDVAWKIVKEGRSRFFPDAQHDDFVIGVVRHPGEPERPRFVIREKIKSSAALLLKVGDETVGVMFANYRTPHRFSEEEMRILETFANYAAVAIQNARLFEREQRREELERLNEELATAMAIAWQGLTGSTWQHDMYGRALSIRADVQSLRLMLDRIDSLAKELVDTAPQPPARITREPINVNPVLSTVVDKYRRHYPDVAFQESLAGRMPQIMASDSHLAMVFEILLSNAVRAVKDSTRKTVGVVSRVDQDQVVVEISDTGQGIAEDIRPLLFRRIVPEAGGMGLGALLARVTLQMFGGTIEVARTGPEGTTIVVTLPVASPSQMGRSELADERS